MLLRDNIVDGRLSKVIEEAFLITAGQKDAQRARIFAEWLTQRQIICFGKDSQEAQKAKRKPIFRGDFASNGAPTDWVNRPNDKPLQNTTFERHTWLWKVDDPKLSQKHICIFWHCSFLTS